MSRSRGRVELPEYASMTHRMVRAYARRMASEGTLDDLLPMLELADMLDSAIALSVDDLRVVHSWREIGDAVGTSGEAARQKWHPNQDHDLPNSAGVYALCDEHGVRYIGKSISIIGRIMTYRKGIAHSRMLWEWLRTRYDTFTVQVLEECETPQELAAAEEKWIQHYAAERFDLLLNFAMVPGRSRRVDRSCGNSEMRWAGSRRVEPYRAFCSRPKGHAGPCMRSRVEFGTQPETSTWTRYVLRTQGRVVTLADYDAVTPNYPGAHAVLATP